MSDYVTDVLNDLFGGQGIDFCKKSSVIVMKVRGSSHSDFWQGIPPHESFNFPESLLRHHHKDSAAHEIELTQLQVANLLTKAILHYSHLQRQYASKVAALCKSMAEITGDERPRVMQAKDLNIGETFLIQHSEYHGSIYERRQDRESNNVATGVYAVCIEGHRRDHELHMVPVTIVELVEKPEESSQ